MNPKISAIAAVSENGVIGHANTLPWHIPKDFKRFKDITRGHVVIMGRKTYDSMGKALPNRTNIVVTRNDDFRPADATVCHSLEEALEEAKKIEPTEIFVIGGGQIYAQAMPFIDKLYITVIHKEFEGDTLFPDYTNFGHETFREDNEENGIKFTFIDLER